MADLSQVFTKVAEKFNFSELNTHQKESITKVLIEKKDVFVNLPTGYGKSVVFQALPSVFDQFTGRSGHIVLVISPLLSLIEDQIERLQQLGISATSLMDVKNESDYGNVEKGYFSIIYTTPETIVRSERWRRMLSSDVYSKNLCAIAVDEAHVVKQWGTSTIAKLVPFRECYGRLNELRSLVPKVPIVALTATATTNTKSSIIDVLGMQEPHFLSESPEKPNTCYVVQYMERHVSVQQHFKWLVNEAKKNGTTTERTIIYTQTIQQCSHTFITLRSMLGDSYFTGEKGDRTKVILEMIHSCSPKSNKDAVLRSFQDAHGEIRILVATIAFGMGVDCQGVYRTIHFGPSKNIESYVQEAGRAGRDGQQSVSYLLYHGLFLTHVQSDIKKYIQLKECRRKGLLAYFDESSSNDITPHLCCDNCAAQCTCGASDCGVTAAYPSKENQKTVFPKIRQVTQGPKKELERKLIDYHKLLVGKLVGVHAHGIVKSQTALPLLIGFSKFQVNQVLQHCHHLFTLQDVCDYVEIWDMKHAVSILTMLSETFVDISCPATSDQSVDEFQEGVDLEDELDMALDEWNYLIDDDDFVDLILDNLDGSQFSAYEHLSDVSSEASHLGIPNEALQVLENFSFEDI